MTHPIPRFFTIFLLSLLFLIPAHAEIVGQTTDGEYIHRLVADNGQELYFVGDEDPYLSYADVNFDGIDDAVILTRRGASNFVYQFFIFDGTQYAACPVRFVNYDLDAEHKLVISSENGGWAGALHTRTLYRFDGLTPVVLREAIGQEKEDWSFDAEGFTTRQYNNRLTLQVWAYDGAADGTLVFEQEVLMEDENTVRAALDAEEDALWSGIR